MQHKFLFEAREWKAKGTYSDSSGKKIKVTGRTKVIHKMGKWIVEAEIYVPLKNGKTLDLRNVYNVKPMKKDGFETTWTSDNKITGKYTGRFFIAGNVIFSSYSSKKGEFIGFETMEYLGSGRYGAYGKLYKGGDMESSWNMVLV